MARVSMYDIKNASREKREGWEQTQNNEIVAKANEVVAKASTIPNELLNAWDKESIRLAAELAAKDSLEQLRREISRLMELAGEHYGISEKQFWQRYHARKSVAEKDK
jgi:hypothetical protein